MVTGSEVHAAVASPLAVASEQSAGKPSAVRSAMVQTPVIFVATFRATPSIFALALASGQGPGMRARFSWSRHFASCFTKIFSYLRKSFAICAWQAAGSACDADAVATRMTGTSASRRANVMIDPPSSMRGA